MVISEPLAAKRMPSYEITSLFWEASRARTVGVTAERSGVTGAGQGTTQMMKPADRFVEPFCTVRVVPDGRGRSRLPERCGACPRSGVRGVQQRHSRTRGGRRESAHNEPCGAPLRGARLPLAPARPP